jgi:hypothetical protein
LDLLDSCTFVRPVTTINYNAIADSNALQFTTASTKSSQSAVSSLDPAWQRLHSFRVQRPPSSLALLHCRLHSAAHCLPSDSVPDCAQSRCSVTASNGGRSYSSGLTPLQPGDHHTPASCPHCRLSAATQCSLKTATHLSSQDCPHWLTGLVGNFACNGSPIVAWQH